MHLFFCYCMLTKGSLIRTKYQVVICFDEVASADIYGRKKSIYNKVNDYAKRARIILIS